VFRRQADGGFVEVPVELGPSDLGTTVVTAGLSAGDLVALRDPQRGTAPAADAGDGSAGGSSGAISIGRGAGRLP
jgi:hypothetical protein